MLNSAKQLDAFGALNFLTTSNSGQLLQLPGKCVDRDTNSSNGIRLSDEWPSDVAHVGSISVMLTVD